MTVVIRWVGHALLWIVGWLQLVILRLDRDEVSRWS